MFHFEVLFSKNQSSIENIRCNKSIGSYIIIIMYEFQHAFHQYNDELVVIILYSGKQLQVHEIFRCILLRQHQSIQLPGYILHFSKVLTALHVIAK